MPGSSSSKYLMIGVPISDCASLVSLVHSFRKLASFSREYFSPSVVLVSLSWTDLAAYIDAAAPASVAIGNGD